MTNTWSSNVRSKIGFFNFIILWPIPTSTETKICISTCTLVTNTCRNTAFDAYIALLVDTLIMFYFRWINLSTNGNLNRIFAICNFRCRSPGQVDWEEEITAAITLIPFMLKDYITFNRFLEIPVYIALYHVVIFLRDVRIHRNELIVNCYIEITPIWVIWVKIIDVAFEIFIFINVDTLVHSKEWHLSKVKYTHISIVITCTSAGRVFSFNVFLVFDIFFFNHVSPLSKGLQSHKLIGIEINKICICNRCGRSNLRFWWFFCTAVAEELITETCKTD